MEIFHLTHPPQDVVKQNRPCVMALGFFDGIHLGHQQVIHKAREIAEKQDLPLSIMTFYPHPKHVVGRSNAPVHYLTPLSRKKEILAKFGVKKLYIIQFDYDFSILSPMDFVRQYLIDFHVQHVVAGFDFRYGYKGEGNVQTLRSKGQGMFHVEVIDKVTHNGEKISSTLIRELISLGHVSLVPPYLGTFYGVKGRVDSCYQLDKNLNLSRMKVNVTDQYLLPKAGVYAVEVTSDNGIIHGIGHRLPLLKSHESEIMVSVDFRGIKLPQLSFNEEIEIKWLFRMGEKQEAALSEDLLYRKNEGRAGQNEGLPVYQWRMDR